MPEIPIPNLFIVGAPKAGTTSLYTYLEQHQDVFMCPIKEPNHFCTDYHEELQEFHNDFSPSILISKSQEEYLKLFQKGQKYKILGEASVWYLSSKTAAREIAKFNPDAKIIISIREPSALLHSLHSQLLYSGEETESDFLTAINLEKSRRKGQQIPKNVNWPSMLYYSEITNYQQNIQRFYDHFPKNQIKVLIFEEFIKDIPGTFQELLNFLNLPPSTNKIDFSAVNQNKQEIFTIKNKAKIKKFITNKFPTITRHFLSYCYSKVFSRKNPRPKLPSHVKTDLKKRHHQQVKELSSYLNTDLINLWQYESSL